jgi:putative membrane protein
MKLLAELIVRTFVLIITAYIVPGFKIGSLLSALILAVVLSILNTILKPILTFLTLPATIITLGLFTFVINAILLIIAAKIVPGFEISSFWSAIVASVVIAVVSGILNKLIK